MKSEGTWQRDVQERLGRRGYGEFGLSHEDAQDKHHRRLKIKKKPVVPDLPEKWPLKRVCVCMHV